MSKLNLKSMLFEMSEEIQQPMADMCGCEICGWKGKVSDCATEWESEGWEYPEYQIQVCPKCEDGGCISDYWFSDEIVATMQQSEI